MTFVFIYLIQRHTQKDILSHHLLVHRRMIPFAFSSNIETNLMMRRQSRAHTHTHTHTRGHRMHVRIFIRFHYSKKIRTTTSFNSFSSSSIVNFHCSVALRALLHFLSLPSSSSSSILTRFRFSSSSHSSSSSASSCSLHSTSLMNKIEITAR
jgi:hypothetical protein